LVGQHDDQISSLLSEAWLKFSDSEQDSKPLAELVQCSTLFTWGMKDPFVQLKRAEKAIQKFPNATVEEFDYGHTAFLAKPMQFAESLTRFFQQQQFE